MVLMNTTADAHSPSKADEISLKLNRRDKRNRKRGDRLYASQRPETTFRPRKSPSGAGSLCGPVQPRERPVCVCRSGVTHADCPVCLRTSPRLRPWRRPRRANGKRFAHKAAERV